MKKKSIVFNRLIIAVAFQALLLLVITGCGKSPAGVTSSQPPYTPPVLTTTPIASTTTEMAPANLTVLSIVGGNVQVLKTGKSEWIKGEVGMTLAAGDKVRTDAGGAASITFFEGSTIDLQGDTAISLIELDIHDNMSTTVMIKQEIGKTISRAKKLADTGDRYEIETPAAVASVRGSTMYVQVAGDGQTIIGNIEGMIAAIAQGVEVSLPPGTHSRVISGQAPGAPETGATPQITTPPGTTTTTTTTSVTSTTSTTTTTTPTPTTTTTPTPPLTVMITSLQAGDLVGRTVTVSGMVSNPAVTEATFTLNGNASTISVVNGSFSQTVSLADGTNKITVNVTWQGITATDSIECVPEEAPSGR